MSNADTEEVFIVVERAGVRVEKTFEPEDFPVPAIAFTVLSSRDESVEVRLVDDLPEDVAAEDVGLHPKYGAEFWTLNDDRIVFEREFEPGEEFITVYGVRARDTKDIGRFLDEPELDRVEPGLEDSSDAVRDLIGDDADSSDVASAIESVDEGTTDDEVEPAIVDRSEEVGGSADIEAAIGAVERNSGTDTNTDTATDTTDIADATDTNTDTAIGTADTGILPDVGDTPESPNVTATAGSASASADNVASALAEAVRAGNVSERDLDTLRQALGVETGGSVDARVAHIQREVSDMQAYTAALEEFLDENGDAQRLLSDLREELASIETDVETVHERTTDNADRLGDATDDLSALEARVESLAELEAHVEELAGVGERLDTVDDRVDAVEERIDDDVEELRSDVEGVGEDVSAVESEVTSLDDDVEDIRESLADRDVEVVESRIGDLETELGALRDDIDDLARMREQLSSVFGAQSVSGHGTGSDAAAESDAAEESNGEEADADSGGEDEE